MTEKNLDRYRGCLVGLAAGDAVGTTLEFKARGTFTPITDMTGGGPFGLKPGQWTDDTSMALCLAASLLEKNGFDALDQMQRYVRWRDEGYLSSNGRCFDIGITIGAALSRFQSTGNPLSGSTRSSDSGNGSLMRLAPVPMYYSNDLQQAKHYAAESSRTTHGSPECLHSCMLYSEMILRALNGASKEEITDVDYQEPGCPDAVLAIARGEYKHKTEAQISGSGYVVHALEAALWCFWNTDNFASAILAAANLGDDTDTTAAICGQLAGAFYGMQGIPAHWVEKLTMRDEIIRMAEQLAEH